jgi:hypothetical protein
VTPVRKFWVADSRQAPVGWRSETAASSRDTPEQSAHYVELFQLLVRQFRFVGGEVVVELIEVFGPDDRPRIFSLSPSE